MTALSLGILFFFFGAHYHSLLNLLAGSRMTGQTSLRPSRQDRSNDQGVNRCCSVFGVTSTLFPPLGLMTEHNNRHRLAVETRDKNGPAERTASSEHTVSQHSRTRQLEICEAVCGNHSWRSKIRWSLNPLLLLLLLLLFFSGRKGFSESFEKPSTAQLTCSEGALSSNTW